MYAGDAAEGEAVLRPLLDLGEQVTDFSGRMAYVDMQQLFDTVVPFGQHRNYWKSRYLSDLPDAAIDAMIEGKIAPPSPKTLSSIWNLGGATAAVPAEATAFGDRSMSWMVSFDSIWNEVDDDAANIAWSRSMWERLAPWAAGDRIYLNFPGHGEDADTLVPRSYGPNYERLVSVKRTYDPDNAFRFNQNIKPGR